MKKAIRDIIIVLTLLVISMASCTRYITVTKETVKHDTIPEVSEIIKLQEVPVECKFDTTFVIGKYGELQLTLDQGSLSWMFMAAPEKIKETTKTPLGVVRQQEKTKRNTTDETNKTSRDSMDNVIKGLRAQLAAAQEINRQNEKTKQKVSKDDRKTEVAKSKGGIFARIKLGLFWFVVGLIAGNIGINIPGVTGIVSKFIGKIFH